MNSLSEKDYKLFQSLAGLTQEGLRKTLSKYLDKNYPKGKVMTTKDFIYAVGDIPIALIAHMDTVFKNPPTDIFYDKEKKIMWSPDGLGADDRAGVFSILKILQSGLRPTVIFTTEEETGGGGAEELIKVFPSVPNDLRYIIQLDRRGSNDCVFYNCVNKNFISYVEKFGFAEAWGTFTDISIICPQWGIAGVNLSVGYENEHSLIETLNTTQMLQTITKVKKMLEEESIPKFDYIPGYVNPYQNFNWIDWEEDFTCAKCGKSFNEYEVLPIMSNTPPYKKVYYCPDCCTEGIEWCTNCGEGFEINEKGETCLCPKCTAKYKQVIKINGK